MKSELFKKAVQLKLASMSEHWHGNDMGKKSGKHRSQEMQKINSKRRAKINKAKDK